MPNRLSEILRLYSGNSVAAMKYCIRISIEFPQFKSEYEGYARQLARIRHDN